MEETQAEYSELEGTHAVEAPGPVDESDAFRGPYIINIGLIA